MNRKLLFSFTLSCISLIATTWINISIAKRYLHADGKTRALFGMNELLSYGYQYLVAILGITALVLSLTSRPRSRFQLICITLSILSIILVFVRLWRLFC
ncbi:hypothetical protein [Niastella koreensis]|nr:hypothetical protein [Niastella koreensis]